MTDDYKDIDNLLAEIEEDNKSAEADEVQALSQRDDVDDVDVMVEFVNRFFNKFEDIGSVIMSDYHKDRGRLETALDDLYEKMSDDDKRIHFETFANLMRTKVDSVSNMTRLMEAMAKFLAANKGASVFQNTTNNINIENLDELLDKPLYPDES